MTEARNNADGSAKPGSEASSSEQSELSRLISEYEGSDDGKTVAKVLKAIKPAVDHVEEERQNKAKARVDDMIKEATDFLLDSEDLEVFKKTVKNPGRLARGYIEGLARESKDFEKAADDFFRGENEAGWKAQLGEARKSFVEEFGALKDLAGRDDTEAARLAVAGQTSTEPPDEGPSVAKMFSMTDQEWENYKAEELAKAQR